MESSGLLLVMAMICLYQEVLSVPCLETNTDYSGNTVRTLKNVRTWQDCSKSCRSDSKCFAWTWATTQYNLIYKHRWCFMKNNLWKRGRKDVRGLISGSKYCTDARLEGNWGSWAEGLCTRPCGGGTKIRSRRCDNPKPINGGKKCVGDATESATCNSQQCPKGFFISVFVDSDKGNNSNSCATPHFPCKDIRAGIKKVVKAGTLYVKGTHVLTSTIQLTKSITIRSDKEGKGVIKGNGLTTFAFRMQGRARIRLSNLHFDTIGILAFASYGAQEASIIEIENVRSYNTQRLPQCVPSIFDHPCTLLIIGNPPSFDLSISNSEFRNISTLVMIGSRDIRILNCSFYNAYGTTGLEHNRYSCLRVSGLDFALIKHTLFTGCTSNQNGGALAIILELPRGISILDMKAKKVVIQQSRFIGCSSNDTGGALYLKEVDDAEITESDFTRCTATTGAAIGIIDIEWRATIKSCNFVRNEGRLGGGVYLRSSKEKRSNIVKIEDVAFLDNKALAFGQAIYSTATLVLSNVTTTSLTNISVDQLHLEGEKVSMRDVYVNTTSHGMIQSNMVRNGIFVSSMKIQLAGQLEYLCPIHFQSRTERSSYLKFSGISVATQTLLKIFCESCNPDSYTLSIGELNVRLQVTNPKQTDPFNITKTNGKCLKCPTGGVCRGDIKPLDNYWGYLGSDFEVKFVQCPPSFCCSSQTTPCTSFNTCNMGRRGTLCGSCDIGYSQSFVSNGCVKKDGITCDVSTFKGYFITVSLFYTVVLTFLAGIMNGIHSLVAAIKGTKDDDDDDDDDVEPENENILLEKKKIQEELAGQSAKIQETPRIGRKESTKIEEENPVVLAIGISKPKESSYNGQPPISAFITLIAFFFQVASLVHVKIQQRQESNGSSDSQASESAFQKALFDLFNFRITVSRKLCPTDELTLLVKEFINVALKISSISNLMLFFVIGKIVSLLRICSRSTERQDGVCGTEQDSDTTSPGKDMESQRPTPIIQDSDPLNRPKLSFNSTLKIGFIKLIKLNFTSITTFCFHMTSCVEVGENLHLYFYGDLQCYVWWQKIILGAVLPLVLTFPASFGMALNLLKDEFISTNQFLVGSVIPIYTLFLLIKKRTIGLTKHSPTEEEDACVKAILEMEEELFSKDDHLWRWTVIQLYRNVLIVLLNVFILNPIYRCMFFICVFGMFAIHDRLRQPYEHPYLNHLQLFSSASLLILSACSIPASISLTFDIMSVPYMTTVTAVVQYIEITIYIAVPLSLVMWLVIQKFLTRVEETKHISSESRRGSGISHVSGHLSIF